MPTLKLAPEVVVNVSVKVLGQVAGSDDSEEIEVSPPLASLEAMLAIATRSVDSSRLIKSE